MRRSFRKLKDKESFFIADFQNRFIGDDGAVIENLVYTKDLFFEDIHFKREWMSLKDIAVKSMLINISDAIVMNAKVKYALIGIEIPKDFSLSQMRELYEGFQEISLKYGFYIVGGDTIAGDKLNISVTLVSETKKPVFRSGTKEGDFAAFTGNLGSVKKDLTKLLRGGKVSSKSKFIKPVLRDKFFYEIAPFVSSAMDISDGLSKDLSRISLLSGVGFKFLKKFDKNVLCSGEEYEILFTFPPRYMKKIENIAKKRKTKITIFARAVKGGYKSVCKPHHF